MPFPSKDTYLAGSKIDLDAGRRTFMRSAGLAAAGVATMGVTGLPGEAEAQQLSDPIILNFALNLEYLEAEFYLRAAFGRGLADSDINGQGQLGPVSGGRQVNFATPAIRNYAREIASDEEAHVKFLRAGLGSAAVARPAINIDSSFTAAATAAGLITAGQAFDVYANENNFLLGAFIFEDVGVTAYKGAARFIRDPGFLEAAAGLLAVEAYHAGEIRTLLYSREQYAAAEAISNARDSLDNTPTATDLDQGIGNAETANIVPTDENGLAFSRSPTQILNIVYLGGPANNNGFFPNQLNGTVR